MKKQQRKLQVEHQRLLIEQQTFSATPQIASRAVSELNMYSPTLKDKLIIQLGAPVPVPVSAPATASTTTEAVAAANDEVLEPSPDSTPKATEAGQ